MAAHTQSSVVNVIMLSLIMFGSLCTLALAAPPPPYPEPSSAAVGAYVGLALGAGLCGFIYFVIHAILYFRQAKPDETFSKPNLFSLCIMFPTKLLMAIVFFSIAFKDNLLSDQTQNAYECVASTASDVGVLSVCQSILTTCSISTSVVPVDFLSAEQCVQEWLVLISFIDGVSSFALLLSVIWFWCFCTFFGIWIDKLKDNKAFYVMNWFMFWHAMVGLGTGIAGFVDEGHYGCYAAHCKDFVNTGQPYAVTYGLEILHMVDGTGWIIYFFWLIYTNVVG